MKIRISMTDSNGRVLDDRIIHSKRILNSIEDYLDAHVDGAIAECDSCGEWFDSDVVDEVGDGHTDYLPGDLICAGCK